MANIENNTWLTTLKIIMKTKIPGLTFSWKRAIGLTQLKQKISRETGIPMSKQGLERKIGSVILKKLFEK